MSGAAPLVGQAPAPPTEPTAAPEEAAERHLEGGRPREALAELESAEQAYRRAGDRLGRARVSLMRSRARRGLGDLEQAARDAEEAAALGRSDPSLLIRALTQIGRVATDRSEFTRGEAALHEAVGVARTLDDAAQANALWALAVFEDRRGRQEEALAHHLQAVEAADRSGDVALRVNTRGDASATLLGLSRYDAALATAQEAYDIADRAGTSVLRANALFDLAQTNAHVWNLDRAAELWAATIEANRETGNIQIISLAQKQSVETWFALGDFDRSAAEGATAIELLGQAGLAQYVAETAARVALSEVRRGRTAEARAWADRARAELARAPESRHLFVHNDLGIVETELGDLARARADYARVLEVSRQVGNVEYEWRAHWGFGRTALRDRPGEAAAPLEQAIASVERLRQTIPGAGLRAAFMINRVGPWETLVEAHMATATTDSDEPVRRALEVAERARSRALADLLAEARARMEDPRLTAIRDEETAFGGRFSAIQKRVAGAPDAGARAAALEELHQLEREYETLVVRIRRSNPAYAALTHPPALSAGDIAGMLAPDEALVEFLLTDRQGFAWIVRRDGVRGYLVPGRKALDPQVRLLPALLAARDQEGTERLGEQLHASLLGPGEAALGDARRLIIVADGVLQRLPFALLRSNGRWLVETHTLALAPSATILHHLRRVRPVGAAEPLLGLAAPDVNPSQAAIFGAGAPPVGVLPHATDEVIQAARLLGAPPESARYGPAASESLLKSAEAARYRILHFAAHAVADEIVPRRSAILLTPDDQDDGLLQVSEIANLSLNADLVVLAACRSHVGRLVRGEGLLGLSRAFIHAGARAVVATGWAVPDRETAWLMRRFYEAIGEGVAPDEALQRAQLAAIASGGEASAPATWAAFVLFGEARAPIVTPVETRGRPTLALLVATLVVGGGAATMLHLRRQRLRRRSLHAEAGRG
jgi:CHAT domain-containing protein